MRKLVVKSGQFHVKCICNFTGSIVNMWRTQLSEKHTSYCQRVMGSSSHRGSDFWRKEIPFFICMWLRELQLSNLNFKSEIPMMRGRLDFAIRWSASLRCLRGTN